MIWLVELLEDLRARAPGHGDGRSGVPVSLRPEACPPRRAVQHRPLAEHLPAEYRIRTAGRGQTVDESPMLHSSGNGAGKLPAHKPDTTACERSCQAGREPAGRVPKGRDAVGAREQWFDCVMGCAAAASIQRAVLCGTETGQNQRRKPLRLSDLQQRK